MEITNIQFITLGDFQFSASFLADSHNLETRPLPNTASSEELRRAISDAITLFEATRAQSNLDSLRSEFEGATLTL